MAWYVGDAQITVIDMSEAAQQIIARLQPLASGTVHHIFGYEDPIVKLTAIVVGDTDKELLKSYTRTATSYPLLGDNALGGSIVQIDYGDFLVKNTSFKREPIIKQSIRQDLDCQSPVYNCEIELYEIV